MLTKERINEIRNNPHLQIIRLKRKLADTDYQAIKYAEGELTASEYEPIRQKRSEWRREINRLQEEIKQAKQLLEEETK